MNVGQALSGDHSRNPIVAGHRFIAEGVDLFLDGLPTFAHDVYGICQLEIKCINRKLFQASDLLSGHSSVSAAADRIEGGKSAVDVL